MSPQALLLAVVTALAALGGAAQAGTFQISPTRVDLAARGTSGLIELTNTGTAPMRMQITANTWDQSAAGEILLARTTDLVVFPTLFSLAPGERRKVKVGVTVAPAARERTFRLIIEELPSPLSPAEVGLRVLTRMSVPVFQSPVRAVRVGEVAGATLVGEKLALEVENRGTVSVLLRDARVSGRDALGASIWSASVKGWYLLAAGRRRFELAVPTEVAARLASVAVEVTTDKDSWKRVVALGGD